MSGKSTYMRQVALVTVLAQAGGFVPASAARLPVVDRVFTRVGASDDIAGGQSTFMVEMTELAEILRSATPDSLVLLDEVGRGTSTADGLAIARAVTEFVHDEVGATTLFATHHHELTEAAAALPDARNLHFAAERDGRDVAFDHRIREGAATASYGVEVAGEAGVPDPVVERAAALLDDGSDAEDPHRPLTAFEDAADRPDEDDAGAPPSADEEPADPGENGASPQPSGDGEHGGRTVDGERDGRPAAAGTADRPENAKTDAPPGDAKTGVPPENRETDGPPESRETDGPPEDAAAMVERLRGVDVGSTTPLEALNLLAELKQRVDD
jgi:DNA mismatch repair protein MutS